MTRARTRVLFTVGAAILIASCGSATSLTDDELAECTDAALEVGTIGGSGTLLPTVVLALPDGAIAPEGTPDDEVEATFDAAFSEVYGIDVDEFLSLRDDADAATMTRLGEPPGIGEQVSDEWFVERDLALMLLWNQRHPAGARTFCDLVDDGAIATP